MLCCAFVNGAHFLESKFGRDEGRGRDFFPTAQKSFQIINFKNIKGEKPQQNVFHNHHHCGLRFLAWMRNIKSQQHLIGVIRIMMIDIRVY